MFYRLVSGNSVEERLLKKGIKHLIQEVATQGDDCSVGFLTQVLKYWEYEGFFDNRLKKKSALLYQSQNVKLFKNYFCCFNQMKSHFLQQKVSNVSVIWLVLKLSFKMIKKSSGMIHVSLGSLYWVWKREFQKVYRRDTIWDKRLHRYRVVQFKKYHGSFAVRRAG